CPGSQSPPLTTRPHFPPRAGREPRCPGPQRPTQLGIGVAVPQVVEMLRNLEVSGYSQEHSIMGVSDPFLQVRALRLLRVLGQGSEETSEAMNDTLAQVATNTETSHNAGSAVLYETVLTITAVRSASGGPCGALNPGGPFLRSVALASLLRLVHAENSALQRHRATVLACLRVPDPALQRRVLDLSLALLSGANIRTMAQELLGFLETCPPAMKPPCASGLLLAAERFAPNKRWHIDTALQVLTMAGSSVPDDGVSRLVQLIGGARELHPYIVRRLYGALACDISPQPLVQVATWCIGEYGDLLAASCEEAEPVQVEEGQVLALLERVLQSHLSLPPTRALALTALMKLSTRLQGDIDRIRRIVSVFGSCHDIELQQRAVEYNALFRRYDHLRWGRGARTPGFSPQLGGAGRPDSWLLSPALGGAGAPLNLWCHCPPSGPPIPSLTVWEGDGLRLDFAFQRPPGDPQLLLVMASASRTQPGTAAGFLLQAAVPKSLQVELEPPSGTSVPGPDGAPLRQRLRVRN
uniref:GAE domain-containing protein n=1 Tax=Gopherus agassizii TaxID=38772 RepID=A0A452H174_9SAUR